jgi:hypothetical protein
VPVSNSERMRRTKRTRSVKRSPSLPLRQLLNKPLLCRGFVVYIYELWEKSLVIKKYFSYILTLDNKFLMQVEYRLLKAGIAVSI